MESYKGYSGKHRLKVQRIMNKAIEEGRLANPLDLKCEICGQDKGIKEWHNYDYALDTCLETIQCLCWRCHRNWHVFEKGETDTTRYKNAVKYFSAIKHEGKIFPPVYNKKYYSKEDEKARLMRKEEQKHGN